MIVNGLCPKCGAPNDFEQPAAPADGRVPYFSCMACRTKHPAHRYIDAADRARRAAEREEAREHAEWLDRREAALRAQREEQDQERRAAELKRRIENDRVFQGEKEAARAEHQRLHARTLISQCDTSLWVGTFVAVGLLLSFVSLAAVEVVPFANFCFYLAILVAICSPRKLTRLDRLARMKDIRDRWGV